MTKTTFNSFLSAVKSYTYPNRIMKRKRELESRPIESLHQDLAPKLDAIASKLDTMNDRAAENRNRDLQDLIRQRQLAHPNPLTRFGRKCFSQTDEDGITLEIVRRLDLREAAFCEFGVGNGMENNTLLLAAIGWRGFWVGGEDLAFAHLGAKRFSYTKEWVTRENIVELYRAGCRTLNFEDADVISLDLDGNDLFLCDELLSAGASPALFIVEYNARFIPPIRFCIDYDPKHAWAGDDYYGASLCSFNDLFEKFGYKLVCCNAATGANAFFVHSDFKDLFSDVPNSIEDLYAEPVSISIRNTVIRNLCVPLKS